MQPKSCFINFSGTRCKIEWERIKKDTCISLQMQLETAHGLVCLFSSENSWWDQSYQLYSIKTSSQFWTEHFKQRPNFNGSKGDWKIIRTNFIHLVVHRHHTSFAFQWRATIEKFNLKNVVPSILHNIEFVWHRSHMCDSITADIRYRKGYETWIHVRYMVVDRWKGSDNIIFHIDAFWWKHQIRRYRRKWNEE